MSNILREAQARAWTVWTIATGLGAALSWFGFRGDTSDEGMLELGLIFAAYVLSFGGISGRAKDVSTLVVVTWGGTMGMWCNRWYETCSRSVDQFLPSIGVSSASAIDATHLPAAVAAVGIMTSALLLVATRSTRVAWSCVAASLLAAAVPMFSDDASRSLPWAALAWNAMTAGALAVWAVDEAVRRSGGRCRSCGHDVHDLSSPVCPRCATPLGHLVGRGIPTFGAVSERRPI